MEPAKKSDWQTKDFPSAFSELKLDRVFSLEEYGKLKLGLKPMQMEDKWLIYLEDGTLNFHRSWTGHAIFKVTLEECADGYKMQTFKVNRDAEQYNSNNNEYDGSILNFLIDRLLLNKDISFPANNTIGSDEMAIFKHSVVGYGRSNQQ